MNGPSEISLTGGVYVFLITFMYLNVSSFGERPLNVEIKSSAMKSRFLLPLRPPIRQRPHALKISQSWFL